MQISLKTSLQVQHFLIATVATAPQPIIKALAIFLFLSRMVEMFNYKYKKVCG
jgi:hypothetical protein